MSYERLAYDDQDTTGKMHTDCDAAASEIGVPEQRVSNNAFAALAVETAETDRTSEITVTEAAAKFGSSHLD
ncbi:MAG: hypothetical protein JWP74_2835 [Marmoricola sp.]|nr:hypothetical protein [Marmoricola sp.]